MARRFTVDEARELTARARELANRLGAIDDRSHAFDERLARAITSARSQMCRNRLSQIRVVAAGESCYGVLDTATIGAAGTVSLADVWEMRSNDPVSIVDTEKNSHSLQECVNRAWAGSLLPFDTVDERNLLPSDVVVAAVAQLQAGPLIARCREAAAQLLGHARITEATNDLDEVGGTFKWLLTPRARREELEAAYDALAAQLTSPAATAAFEDLQRLDALDGLQSQEARRELSGHPQAVRQAIEAAQPGATGAAGWPFTSQDAQMERDAYRRLVSSLEGLDGGAEGADEAVRDAVNRLMAQDTLVALRGIPVEELNRDRRGIRVRALQQAGFETMEDIYTATETALEQVSGVGSASAHDAKELARSWARQMASTRKLRLSVDGRGPLPTEIVCAVYGKLQVEELLEQRDALLAELAQAAAGPLEQLDVACRPLSWLFASADEMQRAAYARKQLDGVLRAGLGRDAEWLRRAYADAAAGKAPATAAWDAFEADPATFFGVLEGLVPDVMGSDDDRFGLPEELARAIQDECFFPEGLTCTLRRYQEWGVKYILHQGKVLLGDEMGLGKTVQAVATMVSLKNVGASHFMVVCPASVLENWFREVGRHSKLRVTKIHGAGMGKALEDWKAAGGVAVTTFETTSRLGMLKDFHIDLVVVDEAHYIKNPGANRTRGTLRLCKMSERLLFMTGTALENKVDEMLTLMGYLNPVVTAKAKQLAFMSGAAEFRDVIAPVYYRRKREDVLTELPDLIEKEEWCSLGAAEEEAYERDVLSRNFQAARRVSWSVGVPEQSSKARRMRELVEEAGDDGRKVLVFTNFRKTAETVCGMLGDRCVGEINGSVSNEKRQELIDRLAEAPAGSVLVAQIQAGGTGLNIQSASVVIICEPQYKPSIENQAISRAYRMGQAHNVLVHRLLCEDTVDERVMELLRKKQVLFDAFADRSAAADAAAEEEVTSGEQRRIIEEEIERIKAKDPNWERKVKAAKAAEAAATAAEEDAEKSVGVPVSKAAARVASPAKKYKSQRVKDRGAEPKVAGRHFRVSVASAKSETPQAVAVTGDEKPKAPNFCSNCGAKLEPSANFCSYCGKPVAK